MMQVKSFDKLLLIVKWYRNFKTEMINDLAQMQKSNVWEEASKLKSKDPKGTGSEKVFIVVGPSSSGLLVII